MQQQMANGFISFYQHIPEKIDPIALTIGLFSVRWYALMYVVGFLVVYFLLKWRLKKGESDYSSELIIDIILYSALGVIIGGRLGYVIFYDLSYFVTNPTAIISPFDFSQGIFTGIYGMSFFGGLIGVIIAIHLLIRRKNINFWKLANFIIPAIPAGYFFGRIGNFLNGELYGRATEKVWGMYFPLDYLNILRHPSQLYEAFFEGIVLFLILWTLRNRIRNKNGNMVLLYFFGYGFFRFFIEFFREPDPQVGLILNLTLGQILSFLLVLVSISIFWRKNRDVL